MTVILTARSAAAQDTPTTVSQGSSIEETGDRALILLVFITTVIFLAWFLPLTLQSRRTREMQGRMLEFMEHRFPTNEQREGGGQALTAEEFRRLMAPVTELQAHQSTLDRSLLAFTIVTLFSLVIGAVLISSSADAADLRKTSVAALLNGLATIIGFFFGARTAEARSEVTSRTSPREGRTTAGEGSTGSGDNPSRVSGPEEDTE
jgi:hypothetical protein